MAMDKELKEMYYLSRYNMGRYVKTSFGHYYPIVGFHYQDDYKGYLVISDSTDLGYSGIWWKKWKGITEIFLNKYEKSIYTYGWFIVPRNRNTWVDYKIVNNKDE